MAGNIVMKAESESNGVANGEGGWHRNMWRNDGENQLRRMAAMAEKRRRKSAAKMKARKAKSGKESGISETIH